MKQREVNNYSQRTRNLDLGGTTAEVTYAFPNPPPAPVTTTVWPLNDSDIILRLWFEGADGVEKLLKGVRMKYVYVSSACDIDLYR